MLSTFAFRSLREVLESPVCQVKLDAEDLFVLLTSQELDFDTIIVFENTSTFTISDITGGNLFVQNSNRLDVAASDGLCVAAIMVRKIVLEPVCAI